MMEGTFLAWFDLYWYVLTHFLGFLTYLGYLLLENQHANPVLQCFLRLLLEMQGKQLQGEFVGNDGDKLGMLLIHSVKMTLDIRLA